jgi:hypothetical protein
MRLEKIVSLADGLRITLGGDTYEVSYEEMAQDMGKWLDLAREIEVKEQDLRISSTEYVN